MQPTLTVNENHYHLSVFSTVASPQLLSMNTKIYLLKVKKHTSYGRSSLYLENVAILGKISTSNVTKMSNRSINSLILNSDFFVFLLREVRHVSSD